MSISNNKNGRAIWQAVLVWVSSILLGLLVSSIGIFTWVGLAGSLAPALAVFLMPAFLWLYVKYFSGSWRPTSTQEARRVRFRSIRIPARLMKWSLLGAALIVLIWQSGLVVTFRIIEYPSDVFIGAYDTAGVSVGMAWLMIIMASLVAGICEETGYRGYMQVPLETRHGPVISILAVSILFVVIHTDQVWAAPLYFHLFMLSVLLGILAYTTGSLVPGILAHFVLDIFNFSYWWTDIAGEFTHKPISVVGVDAHFVFWLLLLLSSALLFIYTIVRLRREDHLSV